MRPKAFVTAIRALAFDNTFNPYSCRCPIYDRVDAPKRRAEALLGLLDAAASCEIDALWVGRDLGYRGGRRTGLALTDDFHIAAHASRWRVTIERATLGAPVAERTAAVIWRVLSQIDAPVFLWNVFPLHPHEGNDVFTNRSHNRMERAAGEEILRELIGLLRPRRLIAVGGDAARSLSRMADKRELVQVRHPSYGGQAEFFDGVRALYSCRATTLL